MSKSPDDYDPREEERRRPRRRDDDDYEDDEYDRPSRRPRRAGLDGMFLDTNMFFLVLFGICCSVIALILSIIELSIGRDPEAKQRATTVLIISIVVMVLGTLGRIGSLMLGPHPGRGF